jgi:hypothetical protein
VRWLIVCGFLISVGGVALAADDLSAKTSTPATRLNADEVAELSAREEMQATKAEKVSYDQWAAKVVSCAADGQRLTAPEIESLGTMLDNALEQTVAFGARTTGETLALYFPNVFLDVLDSFSAAVGLIGIGFGTEVHITRYAGIGAGVQAALVNVHWYFNRNLAVSGYGVGGLLKAGPYEGYYIEFLGAGLNWIDNKPSSGLVRLQKWGKFSMTDHAVQQGYSDPYGIGAGWAA